MPILYGRYMAKFSLVPVSDPLRMLTGAAVDLKDKPDGLRAGPQAAWSEALSRAVDEGMQFNPCHALADHRPLGSVNRVRKAVYAMSKRFRAERNGVEIAEPRDLDAVRAAAGA